MKKVSILIIGLMLSINIQSQNYTPLLIDSLYTWSWGIDVYGDTVVGESWSGFSYDSNDSLIQRRSPISRLNYSYGLDTVYMLSETIDTNNNWNIFRRNATAYDKGRIISTLTEKYENNTFEKSVLHSYFYEDAHLDTLYLRQFWVNGEWVNFYKKEKEFDADGNNIEEGEYYADSNGDFVYSRGKLSEYDNVGHLTQEIWVNASSNGNYFTWKANRDYDNDGLLTSIRGCRYSDGICKNTTLVTYDYLGQDTIVENGFSWDDGEWEKSTKKLRFTGPGIYSNKPDSIIYYYYWPGSPQPIPTKRRYFQYEDLGNEVIYFKEEEYKYYEFTDEWLMTRLIEEWYHIKPTVGIHDATHSQEHIPIFPNPCNAGQNLTLKGGFADKGSLELLVFDGQGRLVSKNMLSNQSSFPAPEQEGVYTILIREKGRLIGVSKQIIIK